MIRVGTRGSKLALWQAHYTQNILQKAGLDSEVIIVKTQGDKIQHLGFDKLEGKGFFTKEIEDELLAGAFDMAVHSMKDMPTVQPDGLVLGAVSYRADPRDLLLIHNHKVDTTAPLRLQSGCVVGTSSIRRKTQIVALNDTVTTKDIRGNVPTRIQKLRDGQFDAIVLAAAGVSRLEVDISDLTALHLHPKEFVPAPAQGVLAYQCRLDDMQTRKMMADILHDRDVSQVVKVERTVLKMMDGGCHVPLGVHCSRDKVGNYRVEGAYSDGTGRPLTRVSLSQSTTAQLAQRTYSALTSGTDT